MQADLMLALPTILPDELSNIIPVNPAGRNLKALGH